MADLPDTTEPSGTPTVIPAKAGTQREKARAQRSIDPGFPLSWE